MTTQVTVARAGTIGHEEYSLYSSMSEEELIAMAIEQSLTEDPAEQIAAQKTVTAAPPPREPYCQNFYLYPWERRAAQSGGQTSASGSGVRQRYDGSFFILPQAEVLDPVIQVIKEGDETALQNMIQAGKNLGQPNKDGWLPLHEAAYYGQESCLKLLHRSFPGTIDQRTLQEETALYLATNRGNIDCMRSLLQAGAEPDIANKARETPLYKACERKNSEAVQMLLQYNADVNHRCNRGWTALHEAVARNDLEIIELLVQGGAKVESANCYGISSLFVAAESGHLEALRYLAKCGADINTQASDKASALYEASKNGHEKIVEFLLSQGADANKTNKDGFLPIHMASKKGYYEIVKMLLPVTSRTRIKRSGISPLHLAAERNHDDVMEELIDAGFDVNATLSFERSRLYEDRRTSVLYFSVFNNNVYATELLLEAGADPNVDLINPLLISIRHGCLKTMKLLLDYGANINAYVASHPTTFPATVMFSMKYLALLKFLMDMGCDANSCFTCCYGCGPHPPIDIRRERYNEPAVNNENKIVQFCEMVSTPEMSRWAGPIIDVLLDYVGNVQLCSRLKEHIDSYEDWSNIKVKAEPPRPLAHLCRIKIRIVIGKNRLSLIETLPLPRRLIHYLQYDYSQ
ncbi:ankyrin repeat and SOCS box protein 2 isoform X1 [Pantherophis guttatus]|uniref:Ankyrin repeat and SOCS box protein 2 isoform X1 n=1 Tax=Pantherophis guttatus TaxID=94885 RepID=A0A6P9BS73_PANGU|nr:ankyrin repeat and SOCS box protein 2 isoform X1 [Pantherophis guttatus]XP_060543320.1 ankyrin repeat and SOCS box protein 2 isoform X1 [Pantherophis guttatus]